jgi:hypothetical protein
MERERCLAAVMASVEEIAPVDIEARNADDVADDDFHQAGGTALVTLNQINQIRLFV